MKKIAVSIFRIGVVVCIVYASFSCGAGYARAAASVTINEIMYDLKDLSDTDHEWIELYNASSATVSLQGWKFTDSSSHVLNAPPANGGQGLLSIEPNGYVILSGNAATYLADHPGFTGTVIDTVMSLNNAGATLSIIDASGAVVDSISYTSGLGASSDGNALSRSASDVLSPRPPTPGYQNENTPSPESESEEPDPVETPAGGEGGGQLTSTTTKKEAAAKVIPFKVHIAAPAKITVGVPALFSAKASGTLGEELYSGIFVWSFGDGGMVSRSDKNEFEYTYLYPGEYVVYVEYFQYSNQEKPLAVSRKTIKVYAGMVVVTNTQSDGSIEISNTGSQEVDLKGWSLARSGLAYTFPSHTILLPKSKFTITESRTHLGKGSLVPTLTDPSGSIIELPTSTPSKTTIPKTIKTISAPTAVQAASNETQKPIPTKQIESKQPPHTLLVYMGLGSLFVVAILAVLFLKSKKRELIPLSENSILEQ